MFKQLWTTCFQKLFALNFYTETSTDLDAVQAGRWATRFYLVLLTGSIIILTFYSSLVYNTETVIIPQPGLNTFLTLQTNMKQGLSCPCKEISISQSSLASFSPEFHQLCSSDFLSDHWFSYLSFIQTLAYSSSNNWRFGILPKFRFLQSICDLATDTVSDADTAFGEQRFITASALSLAVFNSQMSLLVQSMINGKQNY